MVIRSSATDGPAEATTTKVRIRIFSVLDKALASGGSGSRASYSARTSGFLPRVTANGGESACAAPPILPPFLYRLPSQSIVESPREAHLRLRAWTFLLLMITVGALPAAGQEFEPGEILVRFKPQAKSSEKAALLAKVGATVTETLSIIDTQRCRLSGTEVLDAVRQLDVDPLVEYAEPNYIWTADLRPDDQQFGLLWAFENRGQTQGTPGVDVNMVPAWDTITSAASIVVGVIDTGIDVEHPDLIDNIFVNAGEIPDNGLDDDGNGFVDDVNGWDFRNGDNNPFDDRSHGTHVAGTIGARGNNALGVVGVCWRVQLLPLKFLDANGSGNNADAIKCLDYAVRMGATISNNSWGGGPFSNALYAAIEAAGEADHIFVAAAGQQHAEQRRHPPLPWKFRSSQHRLRGLHEPRRRPVLVLELG